MAPQGTSKGASRRLCLNTWDLDSLQKSVRRQKEVGRWSTIVRDIQHQQIIDAYPLHIDLGPQQREIFADLHQDNSQAQDMGDFGPGADIKETPATLSDIMSLGNVADAVLDAIYEQPVTRLQPGWGQRTTQFHENWGNIDDLASSAFAQWKASSAGPPMTTPRQLLSTDINFTMELIDMFTQETQLNVTVPDNETIVPHVIAQGYLATTPINPLVAILLQTLEFYKILRERKPSFSVEAFTKVLCDLYEIAMDGNDSQRRLKDKGTAGDVRELDDSDYIIPRLEVDQWARPESIDPSNPHPDATLEDEDMNHESAGVDSPTADDRVKECVKNWKAAQPDTHKKVMGIFDKTGWFACACQHGIILWVADMVQSGEQ
ncbi:hypothetical protein EST38_g6987 [Candolleomyces aberdarensis]|uniref:Uncharacterized protein n=1 Tax=Candolleomyces aberdarensis TaxID=2316362 RepID=A0A4Q2DGA3_9AGAR|nr:hypothetical protein EST38_g6987 [Candolleomyces aberdarensis]